MSSSLLHSAQSLLAGALRLAHTRLELFSIELQEELTRLFFTLIGAVVVVLLLATLGAAFAGAGLLIALSEGYRALAAAAIGIVFLALAFVAAWSLRRLTSDKPSVFSTSLAELERDQEALQP